MLVRGTTIRAGQTSVAFSFTRAFGADTPGLVWLPLTRFRLAPTASFFNHQLIQLTNSGLPVSMARRRAYRRAGLACCAVEVA